MRSTTRPESPSGKCSVPTLVGNQGRARHRNGFGTLEGALSANGLTRFAGVRLPRPASRMLTLISVVEASPIHF
jgi:hypothetical protein